MGVEAALGHSRNPCRQRPALCECVHREKGYNPGPTPSFVHPPNNRAWPLRRPMLPLPTPSGAVAPDASLPGLLLHSQPKSPLWVRPPKPEFQPPAPTCTGGLAPQAGECSAAALTVQFSHCSGCRRPAAVPSSEALKLPCVLAALPVSSSIASSPGHRSHPDSFLPFFLFSYPGAWRFSRPFSSLRSSASVQRVFCATRPTCRCGADVSVGEEPVWRLLAPTLDPDLRSRAAFENQSPNLRLGPGWMPPTL
ncbi:uncharacterized protein LOC112402909 [Neophocaena asiaeorientalis asiaeorientalis]|uniref:Uncharacterized protein LOC112402909 n=1 Tax=Neophocaena asiaeorientalis asiaeorientalis TaxID=1706337 RepID=A0A341BW37_NEOAA|nr:uncharacterized protein LOC112402909 [Neophocaena asiaeorientalis asiaeorientalis]